MIKSTQSFKRQILMNSVGEIILTDRKILESYSNENSMVLAQE